jgi:cob(I)alamin adenosyltransferase
MATKTHLAGKKVSKDKLIIDVLGVLDETSAVIGLAKLKADSDQKEILTKIQQDLSIFSSIIAECKENSSQQRFKWLEKKIKEFEDKTDISKEFILPGINELEARLNLARAVARRAERKAVRLNRQQSLGQNILDYLNRLSWLLFLLLLANRK